MSLLNQQPPPKRASGLQILHTLSWVGTVGVILAALYVTWTIYSNHLYNERAARAIEEQKQAAERRQAEQIFGHGEVKIVSYSIDKSNMARGESADLCYGVVNVTKVVIEPHVEDSKPSAYHCLSVSPKATTTYTITASNDKGESKSLAVTVHVH